MKEALKPDIGLLIKLGSIAVHAEEMLSPHGHDFDRIAIESILKDKEVVAWREQMDEMAFLPVKRNK